MRVHLLLLLSLLLLLLCMILGQNRDPKDLMRISDALQTDDTHVRVKRASKRCVRIFRWRSRCSRQFQRSLSNEQAKQACWEEIRKVGYLACNLKSKKHGINVEYYVVIFRRENELVNEDDVAIADEEEEEEEVEIYSKVYNDDEKI